MVMCNEIVEWIWNLTFDYKTEQYVGRIYNFRLGIVFRLIQLGIMVAFVWYIFGIKNGFREVSEIEGVITAKVKGVVYTNFSDDDFNTDIEHKEWYRRIWDVADFAPLSGHGDNFVATNVIITRNQTQDKCPEDVSIPGAKCDKNNNTCIAGMTLSTGHGIMTGNCIDTDTLNVSTCEVHAWCPVEKDVIPLKDGKALLEASKNFTVLIKSFVDFPKFQNAKRSNIKANSNGDYLKNCTYDPKHFRDCPIFRLGDIVKWSGQEDYNKIAAQGGVISVLIKWNCNFNFIGQHCHPKYEFIELDDPKATFAPGWNFRYVNHYKDNTRTLYKMYGIRLVINVVGQAEMTSIMPVIMTFGAALNFGILGKALCNLIALYLAKEIYYFKYLDTDSSSLTDGTAINLNGPIPLKKSGRDGYMVMRG